MVKKLKKKKKKNSIKEKEVEKEVDLNEMNGKLNNFIKIFINPEEIFFNKRSKNKFCSYFKKYYFKLKTPIQKINLFYFLRKCKQILNRIKFFSDNLELNLFFFL